MTETGASPAVDTDIRRRIGAALDDVEADFGVRIIYAAESGSRAWGFHSPDSDYDVRFIYLRPRDWYLSLREGRDVIELPIEDVLDVNGWDLKKALLLMCKSNPALLEWLCSPIVYREDAPAVSKVRELSEAAADPMRARHHYLSLASRQYANAIVRNDTVSQKKYFYSLRPALALKWLREHGSGCIPMALPDLLDSVRLPSELRECVDDLLRRKATSSELGSCSRIELLDAFIEAEIDQAKKSLGGDIPIDPDVEDRANALFREVVLA